MSITCGEFSSPDLKFLQLKNFQLSNQNDFGGGQCLTVDQNTKSIFVCCQNELIFVNLNSLLNFDHWSKDFLKRADPNLPNRITVKITANPINAHLISISSKGFGTKLAVCCYDPSTTSLSIKFYSLQSLYNDKERCSPYNQFIVPHSSNGETLVRILSWHPEINDNIFACSLTDGSLYILYVSDSDRRVITVLANLPSSRNVTSFSWSPKGKQMVIGFKDCRFSQFKCQINEKDLIQNVPFDEVKKINLPNDFKSYYVCNICWLSTFNFMVICYNPQDNDCRYLIVSIPSAKATGPDAVMKIVDFSCLNIDSIENQKNFEVDILQLENLLFTYTNRSLQFAILGCPSPSDIVSYNKWTEVSLEDYDRLALPCFNSDFPIVRGLAFTSGTEKFINFGSMPKGGPNRHFALTYNIFGHLTLFLTDFQNYENENFLKLPTAPSNIIKPVVSASIIEAPKPIDNVNTPLSFNLPSTNIQPNISSQNLNLSSQANQMGKSFSTTAPTMSPFNKLQSNSASFSNNMNLNKPSQIESTQILEPNSISQEQATTSEPKVDQNLLVEEICLHMLQFNSELKSAIASQKSILSSTSIGTSEEFEKIKCDSEFIMQVLGNLSESYSSLNVDVSNLQTLFIDLQYLYKETQTMLDHNTDPKYRDILRERNLDPITLRKVKEIRSLTNYIDVQLREVDCKFDLEWNEWLQNKRKSKLNPFSPRKNISPTLPFKSFIDEREQNDGGTVENGEKDSILSVQALYQAIANNQRLITNLKLQINEKVAKNLSMNTDAKLHLNSELQNHDNINNLTNVLSKVSLTSVNPNISNKSNRNTILQVECLPNKQKSALKMFLENRRSVLIRMCDEVTNSSFASAIEKIKLKDSKKLLPKLDNSKNKIVKEPTQNVIQAVTNKSIETKAPIVTKSVVVSSSSKTNTTVGGLSILQSKLTAKPVPTVLNLTTKTTESITSVTLPVPKSKPQPVTSSVMSVVDSIAKPIFEDISPAVTPTKDENKTTNLFTLSNAGSISSSSFFKTTNNDSVFSFAKVTNSLNVPATTASVAKQTQPIVSDSKTATTTSSIFSLGSNSNSNGSSNFSFNLGSSTPSAFSFGGNQAKLPTSLPTSTFVASSVANAVTIAPTTLVLSTPTQITSSSSSKPFSSAGLPSFSTSLFTTSNVSSTSTVDAPPAASFSFTKSLSNLSTSNLIGSTVTSTVVNSTIAPNVSIVDSTTSKQPSEIANSQTVTTSIFTTPISSVPSFSTSLFGSTAPKSNPIFATQNINNTPAATVVSSSYNKPPEFSFNNALSGLSLKPLVPSGTSPQTLAPAPSFFGSNLSSSFSFGQPQNNQVNSSNTTSFLSFSSPATSGIENTLSNANICSPNSGQSTSNSFFGSSGFSFGGSNAALSNSATASPFGSLQATNQTTSSSSFFGSPSLNTWSSSNNQKPSLFDNTTGGSFGSTSSPISKQGFAVTLAAAPTASPSFGGNPAFGQSQTAFGGGAAFGSPPSFGSSPTFGSVSSPVFGGSAFGNQAAGSPPFANLNSSPIFGNFNDNSAPTFNSLAAGVSDAKPSFASPVGTSFGEAFSQRRK